MKEDSIKDSSPFDTTPFAEDASEEIELNRKISELPDLLVDSFQSLRLPENVNNIKESDGALLSTNGHCNDNNEQRILDV